ncbi:thiamine diphosphate-binding protein [Lasiosphaeria hispida]|uniref:Pyruvate decarboxylase n=1 Tax=Lasiosphaeria hispida TaxID=260671 RepID=A0AAJ0HB60_9PEZI|nr:thiamine diphosphate-binding protein [Lasiosphaeria hispida]
MPEILIGEYLFRRLKQIGIDTIFGVPGDYELALLDQVEPQGLSWIGTPNELVGAYAADGYARIKGAGALVTTFGPGELSAICGIGGSYCENVPVIHIVGYPPNPLQKSGKILHHTIGDGSYDHYHKISAEISCATTVLTDPTTSVAEIDRVLNAMLYHSKPVYLGISEDIAYSKVSDEYLNTPLVHTLAPSASESEAVAVAEIITALESAKSPILMIDGGAAPGNWAQHVDPLIEALKIPFFVTTMGKGIANEGSPYFKGGWSGAGSWPQSVIPGVENADCILWLGNYPSDFNTGIFTGNTSGAKIIDLQRFSVKIGATKFDARINYVLPKLVEAFESHSPLAEYAVEAIPPITRTTPEKIEHDWLWGRLSTFIRGGDLVITETGTAQAGILQTRFAAGAHGWTQAIYGSIGYATAAAAGASIASKETSAHARVVLITGEGSLQLTVQALSLLDRFGVPPVVLVLNNKGYTVERFFRGWTAGYNEVANWDYVGLAKAFAPEAEVRGWNVATAAELDALLGDEAFNNAPCARVVDMVMGFDDAPTNLRAMFAAKAKKAEN